MEESAISPLGDKLLGDGTFLYLQLTCSIRMAHSDTYLLKEQRQFGRASGEHELVLKM